MKKLIPGEGGIPLKETPVEADSVWMSNSEDGGKMTPVLVEKLLDLLRGEAPETLNTLAKVATVLAAKAEKSELVKVHKNVADEAAMIALDAKEGDTAFRTDTETVYQHNGGSAGDATDWEEINSPQKVTSVAGKEGDVSLSAEDVGAAPVSGGLIPTQYLPPLVVTSVHVVDSETEQLALAAQEGDVCKRTDLPATMIHNGGSAGTMADWTEMSVEHLVLSVNGKTGVIALTAADVGAVASSGDESVSGIKNFTGTVYVPTAPYTRNSVEAANTAWVRDQLDNRAQSVNGIWSFISGLVASGFITINTSSDPDLDASFNMSAVAGKNRLVSINTSGAARWKFGSDNGSESGSDAGSNFAMYRYADNGAYLGKPFAINRNNGRAYFETNPYIGASNKLLGTAEITPNAQVRYFAEITTATYTVLSGGYLVHASANVDMTVVFPDPTLFPLQVIRIFKTTAYTLSLTGNLNGANVTAQEFLTTARKQVHFVSINGSWRQMTGDT